MTFPDPRIAFIRPWKYHIAALWFSTISYVMGL